MSPCPKIGEAGSPRGPTRRFAGSKRAPASCHTGGLPSLDHRILTAPDVIARAAASGVKDPRQRWMLRQPRSVRRSYAEEVLGRADEDRRAEVWMLLQSDEVRRSYVRDVLGA